MKHPLRILLWSLTTIVAGLLFALGLLWIREWRPAPVEVIETTAIAGNEPILRRGDTIRIVSWNIGYAGLGDDMDFFYDGGKRMRTSQARTVENLQQILRFLQQTAASGETDFILLQEVDLDSRRSYGIDEYDSLRRALPGYASWMGLNYVADFVPIPLDDPMGGVKGGVATFSRWRPTRVTRYSYPSGFPFPMRLFNLKRCLLSAAFPVRDTATGRLDTLFVNNTHNTAYDTEDMRSRELEFLRNYLSDKPYSMTMGDWNSCPPGYRPSREALEDAHFRPFPIRQTDFPADLTFVYDSRTPSVRYGYEPYRAGSTTTTVVDFALCGSGIEPVACETIDLGFKNSDHNPVAATFVIR